MGKTIPLLWLPIHTLANGGLAVRQYAHITCIPPVSDYYTIQWHKHTGDEIWLVEQWVYSNFMKHLNGYVEVFFGILSLFPLLLLPSPFYSSLPPPSSHLLSQGPLPYLAVAAVVAAIGISIAFYITQRHWYQLCNHSNSVLYCFVASRISNYFWCFYKFCCFSQPPSSCILYFSNYCRCD